MSREEAIAQLRAMNAQSVVKVTAPFVTIIREAQIREEFADFTEDAHIKIVDVHNSIIRYIRRVMPSRVADSSTTAGPSGHANVARCCPLMAQLYLAPEYVFDDTPKKWGMIARNITEINGISLSLHERPVRVVGARQRETPSGQEDGARKRLFAEFSRFDAELEKINPNMKRPKMESGESNRWTYNSDRVSDTDDHASTSNDATSSDAKKSTRNEKFTQASDICIICMDEKITHGFLHCGLSSPDSSLHLIACKSCADKWMWATKGCPKCRQPVVNVVRVTR